MYDFVKIVLFAAEEEDPALNLDVAEAAKPSEIVVEPRGMGLCMCLCYGVFI